MDDKVELSIRCHGDCATITKERIEETDIHLKLSEKDKARGYVEFREIKITGTFFEDEERPKVCPKCGGNNVSYGVASINGKTGFMSTANIAIGYRALIKALDIFSDYSQYQAEKEKKNNPDTM